MPRLTPKRAPRGSGKRGKTTPRATKSRTPRGGRRRLAPRWLRPLALSLTLLLGLALGVVLPGWLWVSGRLAAAVHNTHTAILMATAREGLAVQDILVEGRLHTPAADLLAALGADRGMPILGIDLDAGRQRIEALPWVARASIGRELPGTLRIRLEERTAAALWQRQGQLVVVDASGVKLTPARASDFPKLPVLVGDDAPAHAGALFALLATQPDLGPRLTAAVRVGKRRWNLRIDNRIDIRLPEEDPALALSRLMDAERQESLLALDVTGIDLRMPDRIVIQLAKETRTRAIGGRDT